MGTLTTRTTCEVGMGHIIATGCFRPGVSGLVGTCLSLGSVGLWHSDADSAEPRAKRPMSVRLAAASCLPSVETECRWASSALPLSSHCQCARRPASCGTSSDRPPRVAPGGRRPGAPCARGSRAPRGMAALAKLPAGALLPPRQRRGSVGTSPRPSVVRSFQKAGQLRRAASSCARATPGGRARLQVSGPAAEPPARWPRGAHPRRRDWQAAAGAAGSAAPAPALRRDASRRSVGAGWRGVTLSARGRREVGLATPTAAL
jgi:hypothetical protein